MRTTIAVLAASLLSTCARRPPTAEGRKAQQAGAPGGDAPAARIAGDVITVREVDKQILGQLRKIDFEQATKTYQARMNSLDTIIAERVLGEKAKARNQTVQQYIQQEVEKAVPDATEAEARKFYDENTARMGGASFEEMKGRIIGYLTGPQRQAAADKLLQEARQAAGVTVLLREPEPERVQVAAVGPSKGPANAPITLVEFSDFQWPFCSRVGATLKQIEQAYPGKVRIVFRDYPLPFHEHAQKAHEAGQCAHEQGKFWVMHDRMFEHQDQLAVPDLKNAAREIGLDGAKFDACLDGGKFAAHIKAEFEAGQQAGVTGTPAFFVNGRMIPGAQPFEEFKKVIDRELQAAK